MVSRVSVAKIYHDSVDEPNEIIVAYNFVTLAKFHVIHVIHYFS